MRNGKSQWNPHQELRTAAGLAGLFAIGLLMLVVSSQAERITQDSIATIETLG